MLIWLCASRLSPCFLLPSFFLTPSAVSVPLRSNNFYEHCEPFISAFEDLRFGKNKETWFDVTHALSTSTCSNLGFLKSSVSKLGRFCWPSLFCADFILLIFIITYMLRTNMKLIRHFAGLLPLPRVLEVPARTEPAAAEEFHGNSRNSYLKMLNSKADSAPACTPGRLWASCVSLSDHPEGCIIWNWEDRAEKRVWLAGHISRLQWKYLCRKWLLKKTF